MSVVGLALAKDWSLDTDEEGHRDYTVVWRVETDDVADGPDVAFTATGLPTPGASLSLGNTVDAWAFYNRKGSARLRKREANRKAWDVTTMFSSRPPKRCNTNSFDDPLLEPHRVNGDFNQSMEEALQDNSGTPLNNSSEQRYTGAIVQKPTTRPIVKLQMNVLWIDLAWMAEYADAVNSDVWWGQAVRTIECTIGPWERRNYGTCNFFFVVNFTFELRLETWDYLLLDEGTRVKVSGASPARYTQYKDEREENGKTLLDGNGNALAAGGTPVWHRKRVLKERPFAAVGWPASLF